MTNYLINPVENNLHIWSAIGQYTSPATMTGKNKHYNAFPGTKDRTAEAEHRHEAKVPL